MPFDEPTLPELYSKIKKGSFAVSHHFSPLAEDLIKKCLVVNPLQRITIAEIKKHPWFRQNSLFIYPKLISQNSILIDESLFNELIENPLFSEFAKDKTLAKEKILKRTQFNLFTTSYEMLIDSKNRKNTLLEFKKPLFADFQFSYKTVNFPQN